MNIPDEKNGNPPQLRWRQTFTKFRVNQRNNTSLAHWSTIGRHWFHFTLITSPVKGWHANVSWYYHSCPLWSVFLSLSVQQPLWFQQCLLPHPKLLCPPPQRSRTTCSTLSRLTTPGEKCFVLALWSPGSGGWLVNRNFTKQSCLLRKRMEKSTLLLCSLYTAGKQ